MTISEANAVNVLLTHILGKHRHSLDDDEPSPDDVRQAAEILAAKAHRALYAGWMPEWVAEAWEAKRANARRRP